MAEPALTVADLEAPKSTDTFFSSDPHTHSTKETGTMSSFPSILKKSKPIEKKVLFSDPSKYSVHEISFTKPQPSTSVDSEAKDTLSGELPTIESQGTESLKTLSLLNSEGLLKSVGAQVQSAQDLRWKTNTIAAKHHSVKHFGQSACEIFRQRLNNHYIKSYERNMNMNQFDLQKPDPLVHMVVVPKKIMLVRSYHNSMSSL